MSGSLSVRLSEQERGLLEAYAESAGVGVSAYARQVLKRHVGLDESRDELRHEVADLRVRVERLEGMAGL